MPKIYPYHGGSKSAAALGHALGWPRIRRTNSTYLGNDPSMWIVNWGCRALPGHIENCRVVNNPFIVNRTANKLKFLKRMTEMGMGHRIPPWTTVRSEAQAWYDDGKTVVERHKVLGKGGAGIVIVDPAEGVFVDLAPLYTQYLKKKTEYRVHYMRHSASPGSIPLCIDIQEKKRKLDVPDEDVNWTVRNLAGGFIYAREDINVPDPVVDAAYDCMLTSGLDFGAVDVLYNDHANAARVLEINTAPGLAGQTVTNYAKAFETFCV